MHSTDITNPLRAALTITGPQVKFTPEEVSARSMSAESAITILMPQFDTDTIWLVGIWKSDAMICYLHTLSQGFTSGLIVRMVQHRDYAITPRAHGG